MVRVMEFNCYCNSRLRHSDNLFEISLDRLELHLGSV